MKERYDRMSKFARCAATVALSVTTSSCSQPPVALHVWTPQDQAVFVQDWDHAAQQIADGLAAHGLLRPADTQRGYVATNVFLIRSAEGATYTAPQVFSIRIDQNSTFLRQLKEALETEITNREGIVSSIPGTGIEIDLGVDVVRWGSRSSFDPSTLRREAVWQATVVSNRDIVLSLRQPFYIFDSDAPLYESSGIPARPLLYSTR